MKTLTIPHTLILALISCSLTFQLNAEDKATAPDTETSSTWSSKSKASTPTAYSSNLLIKLKIPVTTPANELAANLNHSNTPALYNTAGGIFTPSEATREEVSDASFTQTIDMVNASEGSFVLALIALFAGIGLAENATHTKTTTGDAYSFIDAAGNKYLHIPKPLVDQ